jgi:hypothetical protein
MRIERNRSDEFGRRADGGRASRRCQEARRPGFVRNVHRGDGHPTAGSLDGDNREDMTEQEDDQ